MRTCLDQTGANFKSRFPGMAGGGFCCPGCVSCDCVERTSAAWLCEDPAEGAVIGSGGGGLLIKANDWLRELQANYRKPTET